MGHNQYGPNTAVQSVCIFVSSHCTNNWFSHVTVHVYRQLWQWVNVKLIEVSSNSISHMFITEEGRQEIMIWGYLANKCVNVRPPVLITITNKWYITSHLHYQLFTDCIFSSGDVFLFKQVSSSFQYFISLFRAQTSSLFHQDFFSHFILVTVHIKTVW